MDPWDFTRCLGILLDNAAEAALEAETPWVEIVLLSQQDRLSLRVSNPYIGEIDPGVVFPDPSPDIQNRDSQIAADGLPRAAA